MLSKPYKFSYDFFTQHIPIWEKYLTEFKDQPDVHYLEIGVLEGQSALWMLENILIHPSAHLTGVDCNIVWFMDNLKISGLADKVTTINGFSADILKTLLLNSFDIIYVDAAHDAASCLTDSVLSWPLLKNGGIMIFDDYPLGFDSLSIQERPEAAIDAFLVCFKNSLEVIHKGYQVFIKKVVKHD